MARTSQNRNTATTPPAWCGDFRSRDHLIPGGVILDQAAFAALSGTPYLTTGGYTRVPAGVAVGRTYTERDANAPMGPAAATDDEIYLIAFDTDPLEQNPDATLYRPGSMVKENYLPEVLATTMISGVLTKLRAAYRCTNGTD